MRCKRHVQRVMRLLASYKRALDRYRLYGQRSDDLEAGRGWARHGSFSSAESPRSLIPTASPPPATTTKSVAWPKSPTSTPAAKSWKVKSAPTANEIVLRYAHDLPNGFDDGDAAIAAKQLLHDATRKCTWDADIHLMSVTTQGSPHTPSEEPGTTGASPRGADRLGRLRASQRLAPRRAAKRGFQPLGVEGAWKAPVLGGEGTGVFGERMAWVVKARRFSTAWG